MSQGAVLRIKLTKKCTPLTFLKILYFVRIKQLKIQRFYIFIYFRIQLQTHFLYDFANGNSVQIRRLYQKRYPDRVFQAEKYS